MSNLKVDTITALDGGAPSIPGFEGSGGSGSGADAWGVADGSGNFVNGLNVASVTRNSTGNYSVVFTTPMPDANYAITTGNLQANSIVEIVSQDATGFNYLRKAPSNGTLTDLKTAFAVFATNALPPTGGTGTDAWLVAPGALTNGAITPLSSFNIDSITRTGSGQYSVTFTTPMPTDNYSAIAGINEPGSLGNNYSIRVRNRNRNGFSLQAFEGDGPSAVGVDPNEFSVVVNATNATLPLTYTTEQIDAAINNPGASAWGTVDANNNIGASSVALLNGLNVASVSGSGTGTVLVTFSTPMPDSNYAVNVSYNTGSVANYGDVSVGSKTTTSFQVQTYDNNNNGAWAGFAFTVFSTNALPSTGGTGTDAWGVIQSDGTNLNSFNIASITKIGTGAYQCNFTTPMPTTQYAVNVTPAVAGGDYTAFSTIRSTTSCQVQTALAGFATDAGFSFTVNATNATLPATLTQDMILMKSGDTMTGALNVPAGASGTQAPQVQEVVTKAGFDTMTGNLNVESFISVLDPAANASGAGIINGLAPYSGMYIDSPIDPTRTGAIANQISSQTVANLSLSKTAPATTGSTYIRFNYAGSVAGSVTHQTSTSINYNATSDYRLKENVVPIVGAASLVNQLKPYRYNFISNPELPMLGFLAHEVQEVLPSVVTGTKDAVDEDGNNDYQQMDYSKLTPILTAALQEALARIETLEAKVQSMIDAH